MVNFDLGERFPRPRSSNVLAVLWVGAGGPGITPGKFFEIFDDKSRVWGQFGPENKLIEGQSNEYDVI